MAAKEPRSCIECGETAINHEFTYANLLMDEILRPLIAPGPLLRWFGYGLNGIEQAAAPAIMRFLVAVGVAKKVTEPDKDTSLLGVTVWDEARARGIEMWEWRLFNLPRNIFVARYPDGKHIAFEGVPEPKGGNRRVWWMDNKAELKKRFIKLGLPVARGGSAGSRGKARSLFRSLTPPVIVKPFSGSGSRHTVLRITDEDALMRGYDIAHQVAPFVVVEEELSGLVYRVTVVGGRMIAALRRYPPQVTGDGTHTVRELVAKENEHPLRKGPYFFPIELEEKAREELALQGLTFESVLEEGRTATLHQKINWTVGGTTEDVTDMVHPENVALFERVSRELNAPLVGIDFILGDITKPWHEQERCGVLECNSMPFFENHTIVFRGAPRNIAGPVWDMVR